MHSPVNLKHARMVDFLDFLIRSFIEKKNLGGELHREVVAVKLNHRNVFLPDLAYFTGHQVKVLAETHAPFAPKWVREVMSPSSVDRDTGPKFAAYEQHGVEEYWLIDPETSAHQFFRKSGELFVPYAEGAEWVETGVIEGFMLRRSWICGDDFPKIEDCLAEISNC